MADRLGATYTVKMLRVKLAREQYSMSNTLRVNRVFTSAKSAQGFSLLEMAVVMVVIGLLLGGLLMPLATQRDISTRKATQSQLDDALQALIGFAIINGRLPCPATATSNGESPATCTGNAQHGFVPTLTLGLTGPVDAQNRFLDSWHQPIRYSLTSAYSTQLSLPLPTNGFRVCRNAACGAEPEDVLAQNLALVLVSTGKDGAQATTSPDQLSNKKIVNFDTPRSTTNDFVSKTMAEDFDDLVLWLSPNALALNLARTGSLQAPANQPGGGTGNPPGKGG